MRRDRRSAAHQIAALDLHFCPHFVICVRCRSGQAPCLVGTECPIRSAPCIGDLSLKIKASDVLSMARAEIGGADDGKVG